jgi:hypothetical protein
MVLNLGLGYVSQGKEEIQKGKEKRECTQLRV